jgi:hypothetical protein
MNYFFNLVESISKKERTFGSKCEFHFYSLILNQLLKENHNRWLNGMTTQYYGFRHEDFSFHKSLQGPSYKYFRDRYAEKIFIPTRVIFS